MATSTTAQAKPMDPDQKQQPDTKPGEYYVTAADGGRMWRFLGPFTDNHRAALDMVDAVRTKASDLDPRAFWCAYGTARFESGDNRPGTLNQFFDLQ